jgi:hypothetical protein
MRHLLEQKNVGFRSVNLVMLPAQTLSDAQSPPLLLMQDLEGSRLGVEVVLRYDFEHALGKHHVPAKRSVAVASER